MSVLLLVYSLNVTLGDLIRIFGIISPFGVAWFVWELNSKNERRRAQRDYLEAQLKNFYGPVAFYALTNARLFGLADRVIQSGK